MLFVARLGFKRLAIAGANSIINYENVYVEVF